MRLLLTSQSAGLDRLTTHAIFRTARSQTIKDKKKLKDGDPDGILVGDSGYA